jgi:hypothetical protein
MLSRREFLKSSSLGIGSVLGSGWLPVLAARAAAAPAKPKSCILLWLGGGPSHVDTFDMKPDAPEEYRGQLKPIATSVPGIQISECFPKVAKLMQHAAIIRGMSTPEFDHSRASYHLHKGYRQGTAGLDYPSLGSTVSAELGNPDASVPNYVLAGIRVDSGRSSQGQGPGFLGPQYRPLEVVKPELGLENVKPLLGMGRFDEQANLLSEVEQAFYKNYNAPAAQAHATTVQRAARLMHAKELQAFDLAQEPAASRNAYTTNGATSRPFGQGCLLARRLVEVGVSFVEVDYHSWDHHGGIYTGRSGSTPRIQEMSGVVDQMTATLVTDLKDRGLLDRTLIIVMGEFGRTPKMNNTGRDHYSKAWSTLLIGGGIKGGQVIGKTDKVGAVVEDRPVSVIDFFATICSILGIDYSKAHKVKPGGRPIPLVEPKSPRPVEELIA